MTNRKKTLPLPKFYWSASRHWLWNDCQKCFCMKYIDKVPSFVDDYHFRYGRFFHEAIDNIVLGNGDKNPPSSDLIKVHELKETHVVSYKKHIELFLDFQKKAGLKNSATEIEIRIELSCENPFSKNGEKLLLYGFLDFVEFSEDTKEKPTIITIVLSDDGKYKTIGYDENLKIIENFTITKIFEFKTSTASFSKNKINSTPQFAWYSLFQNLVNLNSNAKAPLFSLVNFIKDKTNKNDRMQMLNLSFVDYEYISDEVSSIMKTLKSKEISGISTCSYFSDYKTLCPTYTYL